ncbi:MAG: hypothetical protein M3Q18_05375 [Actinomycetota bacterium]|nr:hypothetical protein [Actinomycetota bacterium]
MEDRYVEAADSDDPEKRRWLPPDSMGAVVDPWDSGDAQKWIVLDYLSNPSKIMMNGESSGPFRPPSELSSDVPLSRHELFGALTRWIDKGFAKELVLELSRVLDEDMSDFIDELSKALGMEIEDLDKLLSHDSSTGGVWNLDADNRGAAQIFEAYVDTMYAGLIALSRNLGARLHPAPDRSSFPKFRQ